jgi:hypothetical protein
MISSVMSLSVASANKAFILKVARVRANILAKKVTAIAKPV